MLKNVNKFKKKTFPLKNMQFLNFRKVYFWEIFIFADKCAEEDLNIS